ncbi:response regulator [Thiorhodococcus mannitoliphagus]|uniref:Response regulator n=1 Tax=Thiorhodococcus mannitoliphagus TaxID=329406 RepID=A0A6P1DT50_9GAMM|nr:tetratricopeptide repeat-containing response regulator [Thiorhodococcus mannitoliphagus]NEX20383.1 response regulator [Thiorhodococcus mannitoliphagus]
MANDFSDKSFLVVDDFPDMRSAIRHLLRSLGVSTLEQARDGQEAIAQLTRTSFDVILCDYNLGPGKDGQQVLEEARHRQLIGVNTIFIMITAENTREMVMSAIEYSPDSYLAKPFTKELLRTRLTKLFAAKANLAEVNKALIAKDYAAAISELDRLIAAKPKNLSELIRTKTDILLTAKRYEEAKKIFEDVLGARDLPWARLGLGKVYFWQKKYPLAQEVFEHIVGLDANMIAAYDWLAKTQTALKQFTAAEKTIQSAARLSPRGLPRQQLLGELALSNGNTHDAELAFGRAVALAKHSVLNHPSLFAGLAKSKSANGKHAEALKVVADIGKTFANGQEAELYAATATATVKKDQGDMEGAAAALKAAEESMQQMATTRHSSKVTLEMAKTYAQLGEQKKAEKLIHEAIANNHDEEELLMEVVQVCRDADLDYDAETAIREIQQAVVKTNNEGVRLIKQGQFEAAIQLLSGAADEMPGNKTINLNAAKAIIMKMESMGATADDITAVRHFIERVRDLDPNDWRLGDVISRLRQLATGAS